MNNIEICKKCNKRNFDFKQGIVCGLTNEKPTFNDICPDFEKDPSVVKHTAPILKSNAYRSKTALLFIWIVLAIEVLSLISSGLQYNLLLTASNGGEITYDDAAANDIREQIIALIYVIANLISGIVFIMWFRRAYFNLHQLVKTLSYKEGWAAGSWFVPIVNLYRPFQIMKELYIETKNYINEKVETTQIDLNTKYVGFWWILWIINGIFGQIIFRISRNADNLPELLSLTTLNIIGSLLGIGLCLVTLKTIKDYSKVEGLLLSK